jgi:hypothetical protein
MKSEQQHSHPTQTFEVTTKTNHSPTSLYALSLGECAERGKRRETPQDDESVDQDEGRCESKEGFEDEIAKEQEQGVKAGKIKEEDESQKGQQEERQQAERQQEER